MLAFGIRWFAILHIISRWGWSCGYSLRVWAVRCWFCGGLKLKTQVVKLGPASHNDDISKIITEELLLLLLLLYIYSLLQTSKTKELSSTILWMTMNVLTTSITYIYSNNNIINNTYMYYTCMYVTSDEVVCPNVKEFPPTLLQVISTRSRLTTFIQLPPCHF